MVYQHPELTSVPTAAPTLGKMSRHLLLQACALHKLRVHFGRMFCDSEGKLARYVCLMKSFCGLTSAPRAWWLDITLKLSQLGWKSMSTDQCLWCRYSDDGEQKGVIGIQVDDFLIGLADRILGEKWMSEIKSLYRWGSWTVSESEFAGIGVRQFRDFSTAVDLEDYTNKFITEAPITRERSRQRQESLTAQELSMLRGVLGTARGYVITLATEELFGHGQKDDIGVVSAQQMSPQFAADVSLLLSATADPVNGTPQMTCFRGAKVCTKWLQGKVMMNC